MILYRIFICWCVLFLLACGTDDNAVVIYCALDRIYAEPILDQFQQQTGIKVKVLYDTELTKTVGLVNRIIAEASHPQCDVFWNNEISRTILLKSKDLLSLYRSPSALEIPNEYKDNQGYWTGFAARGRIIIYNKERIQNVIPPSSVLDLVQTRWQGKAAIAYPLFGTTATHAAALYLKFGSEWSANFFNSIRNNQIGILDGNATVRDRVVTGDYIWGLTDTDDAHGAILDGKNVGIIYPDQKETEMGALVIPNTIAIIKGAPHVKQAQALVDFILRPEIEEQLADSRASQIPLREKLKHPDRIKLLTEIKPMQINFEQVATELEPCSKLLQTIFTR